jgi:hypothetical protein
MGPGHVDRIYVPQDRDQKQVLKNFRSSLPLPTQGAISLTGVGLMSSQGRLYPLHEITSVLSPKYYTI